MFHNETRTLYLFELKSTQGSSISYTMLRDNQIEELTKASTYDLVAGFVFNFRKYNNTTYFMPIDEFNEMVKENKKKSFNISDIKKYNVMQINSAKKITRYKYDINEFVKNSHL